MYAPDLRDVPAAVVLFASAAYHLPRLNAMGPVTMRRWLARLRALARRLRFCVPCATGLATAELKFPRSS